MFYINLLEETIEQDESDIKTLDRPCNLLPTSNSSLPLAANWENIPETLLLNGVIGTILFILFLILTHIAWKHANSYNENDGPSLISFLYGYRDPSRWYVMPRYEFVRKSREHHSHEQNTSNIYVPPKLPLANPIELLIFDGESRTKGSKSLDEAQIQPPLKTLAVKSETKQSKRSLKTNETSSPSSAKTFIHSTSNSKSASKTSTSAEKHAKDESRISPLETSFFYPSILEAEQFQASYLSRKLNQFFAIFFKVTDADMIYAKGIDAYEYLLFQRHLILIMFIINIFCLGLLLPVHWFANTNQDNSNETYTTSFQRTTIKNIPRNSIYYWVHIVSSICIILITIYVINSYKDSTVAKHETQLSRRTLLFGNIPSEQRDKVKLGRIFEQYFTGCTIEAIQFVYDTWDLELLQMNLDVTTVAKNYCIHQRQRHNREILVKPTDVNENHYCGGLCRVCSFCLICSCYWPCEAKERGVEFYTKKESELREKITKTFEQLVKEPSEYAFVTFKTYRHAKTVMRTLTRLKSEALSKRNKKSLKRPTSAKSLVSLEGAERGESETGGKLAHSRKPVTKSLTASEGAQFLISRRNNPSDPLDPKNNPYIKSIRSPQARGVMTHLHAKHSAAAKQASDSKTSNSRDNLAIPHSPSKSITINKDGPITWSVRYAPHPDNVEYYDLLDISTVSRLTIILLYAVMIIMFIFVTTPNVILSVLERWFQLQPEKAKDLTGLQGAAINYLSTLLQIIATALLPYLITLISKQIPYEDTSSKNHSIMWKVYLFLVLMVIVMPSVGMTSAQAFLSSDIKAECLFPADNGAYFINYVVSSIFLSLVLELIKPADIVSYYFLLLTGRSKADFESGRQYIEKEFSVSMQHTSVLLIFSVVLTYTISCPLIAPVGLIYLIAKHAVDHYQLFYTYFTKKVDKNMQATIEIFVRVAMILMLFQTTVAISVNTKTGYTATASQVIFGLTVLFFLLNCFCNFAKHPDPSKRGRHERDFCACFYLPRVIEDLLRSKSIPETCISRKV